ncbi:MAG: hypothetical protein JNL67_09425 [Planctomycetaceae bacterium]|nr:hypothetical protein [Planctomycetaceae bacterium]
MIRFLVGAVEPLEVLGIAVGNHLCTLDQQVCWRLYSQVLWEGIPGIVVLARTATTNIAVRFSADSVPVGDAINVGIGTLSARVGD